jgi:hypothetical protein
VWAKNCLSNKSIIIRIVIHKSKAIELRVECLMGNEGVTTSVRGATRAWAPEFGVAL